MYLSRPAFESPEQYFSYHMDRIYGEGSLETLRYKVEALEEIIGRLLNHLSLPLDQLSDVVAGYDQKLEELDEY
jgi:hypothetical protein